MSVENADKVAPSKDQLGFVVSRNSVHWFGNIIIPLTYESFLSKQFVL